nr:MAG TPA: hypothetical protein [Caudoviricetes sp.]
MIIYDCLKCCPVVVCNPGDGFSLRIFMQHYEYKTLSKCRAFIFCTKNTPEKRGVLWCWRSCQTGQLLSGPAWVFSHNVIMHQ